MLAQRGDRVPEISEQSSSCIWDQAPTSCWGLGCQEAPLAPSVLGAWRRDQPLRGIRSISRMAVSAGRIGRVKLQAAGHCRPDDGRAQRTRTAHKSCQEIYMPGVCRTEHAAHLKQINFMHDGLWKWTAGRAHKEGELLARFCCEGGGMPTRYLYYSLGRFLGNPRLTVWTALHTTTVGDMPCALQLRLGSGVLEHIGGFALCKTLVGGEQIMVREATYRSDSITAGTAESFADEEAMQLWPPIQEPVAPRGAGLLDALIRAERPEPRARPRGGKGQGRPKAKRSGVTVSSRKEPVDEPVDEEEPVDEDALDAAAAWNQPPDGEAWSEDSTDGEMEDVVDATAAASTEAPRRPMDRAEARRRVFHDVRVLLASAEHQGLTKRAILNKALDSIDRAGRRFWGAGGVYSRRRTVVDTCLRTWLAEGLPADT